jgi:hypothetical protein
VRFSAALHGAAAAVLLATPASTTAEAGSAHVASVELIPRLDKNCTNFSKMYLHGMGQGEGLAE